MAQFVYTMHRVGKVVPPKRHILKNISLSFFPGAKIGVLGLNGAGKSTLLRIMAGIDTEIEGEARPQPGIKIGYLPQEPQLNPEHTVRESVEEAVAEVVNALKGLDEVYAKYAEPDADFDKLAAQQGKFEEIIQAHDGHNLNVQLDNRRIDEMGQLSGRFNRMAQRLRQNLKDSLRQQRELNEAQIRMMQAQLNPHFLYNTLDTIKWMGKIHQAPEIATISADLADILRSSISADELVPLRQELRLVERYVEIQNIRFSGAFALTVEVDEPLRDVPVPKLMLQPLVENAILHGFRDRSGGEIRISAYRAEEDLILTVRDNGCGVPEEVLAQYRDGAPRPGGHFGLHNVDAILRIRYGPDRGVRFVPVQGEGACIRITLPVFRKGEEPPC